MTKLNWLEPSNREFYSGVDRGVLYPRNSEGVAWHGLVEVQETPVSGESVSAYFDGHNYIRRQRPSEFEFTIVAYSSPEEFDRYENSRDITSTFGFSYRVQVSEDHYQVHLVYNCLSEPTNKIYSSLGSTITPVNLSWAVVTASREIADGVFGAHIVIDSTIAHSWVIEELERELYGTDATAPHLPAFEDLIEMFESGAILRVTDHGDGTWTAEGPDEAFDIVGDYFEITWPSAFYISSDTYQLSSL